VLADPADRRPRPAAGSSYGTRAPGSFPRILRLGSPLIGRFPSIILRVLVDADRGCGLRCPAAWPTLAPPQAKPSARSRPSQHRGHLASAFWLIPELGHRPARPRGGALFERRRSSRTRNGSAGARMCGTRDRGRSRSPSSMRGAGRTHEATGRNGSHLPSARPAGGAPGRTYTASRSVPEGHAVTTGSASSGRTERILRFRQLVPERRWTDATRSRRLRLHGLPPVGLAYNQREEHVVPRPRRRLGAQAGLAATFRSSTSRSSRSTRWSSRSPASTSTCRPTRG
jgi:hypothetical protein